MPSKRYVLIVAGGSGVRMGYEIPKQFIPLLGEPILMHTIRAFYCSPSKPEIVLVLPENQVDAWKDLCKKHSFNINHDIVKGGETRFHSVKNGLAFIKGDGLVAIHDGVRPLVSQSVIEKCYVDAEQYGNAIPTIKPVETVRFANDTDSSTVNRENVHLVQTPQVFKVSIIKSYYDVTWQSSFTDDASVAEFSGERIHLVEGNRENIKITTPFDLAIAEILLHNTK